HKYALLRRKLVSFFEWGGAAAPDAAADETLTAAAWRLTDAQAGESVPARCVEIARAILRKQLESPRAAEPEAPDEAERLLKAFERSFAAIDDDGQELVLAQCAGTSSCPSSSIAAKLRSKAFSRRSASSGASGSAARGDSSCFRRMARAISTQRAGTLSPACASVKRHAAAVSVSSAAASGAAAPPHSKKLTSLRRSSAYL